MKEKIRSQRGNFFLVPREFYRDGWAMRLGPHTSAVYLCLLSYANEDGVAMPSRARIAENAGVSPRLVTEAFTRLSGEGLLVSVGKTIGGVQEFEVKWPRDAGVTLAADATPLAADATPPSSGCHHIKNESSRELSKESVSAKESKAALRGAIVADIGRSPETRGEFVMLAKAASDLHDAGVSPSDIAGFSAWFSGLFKGMKPGWMSYSNNWSRWSQRREVLSGNGQAADKGVTLWNED